MKVRRIFFDFKVNASDTNEVDNNAINVQDISCSALYSATNTYNYNDEIDYDNFTIIPGEENQVKYEVKSKNNEIDNIYDGLFMGLDDASRFIFYFINIETQRIEEIEAYTSNEVIKYFLSSVFI